MYQQYLDNYQYCAAIYININGCFVSLYRKTQYFYKIPNGLLVELAPQTLMRI